jgi:Sensors of blue-light using FAD
MQALEHLIYASVATQTFEVPQLAELLQKARDLNELHGLSGMLLHCDADGSFL